MKVSLRIGLIAALLCGVAAGMAADVSHNYDALFPISVRDKYGYIDTAGSLVIPARYDRAFPFGRVAVCTSTSRTLQSGAARTEAWRNVRLIV